MKVDFKDIDKLIKSATIKTQTICGKITLVTCELSSGFVITQTSGALTQGNYSEEVGKEECLKKIVDRLWEYEGYALAKKEVGDFDR